MLATTWMNHPDTLSKRSWTQNNTYNFFYMEYYSRQNLSNVKKKKITEKVPAIEEELSQKATRTFGGDKNFFTTLLLSILFHLKINFLH
jgi:hypothetical protein